MSLINKNVTRLSFNAFPNEAAMNDAKKYIENRINAYFQTDSSDFCVRKIFGGVNSDWHGTPLQTLFDFYLNKYKSENKNNCCEKAKKQAAIDVGELMVVVLNEARENYICTGYRNNTNWYNKK